MVDRDETPAWKRALRYALPREERAGWLRVHERRLTGIKRRRARQRQATSVNQGPNPDLPRREP